jgi:hypothetical protein
MAAVDMAAMMPDAMRFFIRRLLDDPTRPGLCGDRTR